MRAPHELREAGVIGWECLVPGCRNAPSAADGICEIHRIDSERAATAHAGDLAERFLRSGEPADAQIVEGWERLEPERPTQASPPLDLPAGEEIAETAVEGWIWSIFERLEKADGGRNNALRDAAFSCGRVLGGHHATRDELAGRLYAWAERVDLPRSEARDVIERGLTQGVREPWNPQPREHRRNALPYSLKRSRT